MIKAELSYNPYLLETVISFNGQAPRINSPVEKYQHKRLQEWVAEIPTIFHDEMNDYDFEFGFSGLETDFNRIKASFSAKGVSEKTVGFFYKNELECPSIKDQRINILLDWLKKNPNRRFDLNALQSEYAEIFDTPYSFITVNGGSIGEARLAGKTVSVENVEDVEEELSETVLTDTPVLIFIEKADSSLSMKNIRAIAERDDIVGEQIFFCINSNLNKAQIKRTISDLGIPVPNIVSGIKDKMIAEYFEECPLTCYIKNVLDIFRSETTKIQERLSEEIRRSKIINSEVHKQIERLEVEINLLKNTDNLFTQKDKFIVPVEFDQALEKVIFRIADWRKKKTKTTDHDEASRMAAEYDAELERIYNDFVEEINNAAVTKSSAIDEMFCNWFAHTNIEPNYNPVINYKYTADQIMLPRLYSEFMKLKMEQLVNPKGSILGIFKNNSADEKKEQILETTYIFNSWRKRAGYVITPICRRVIDDWIRALSGYYIALADVYHKHIQQLIYQKMQQKNKVAEQLSDEERVLQNDNDWLTAFKDKLHVIERG